MKMECNMIEIIGNKDNKIYYECDCGAKGFYTIKLSKEDALLVIDITCPLCLDSTRFTISQYSSEDGRNKFSKELNEMEMEWPLIMDNDLI
jgi:hypothetical protein